MSSAAVASAANGLARRSRVRSLDGLRKTSSFRATPPVTPPGEASGALKCCTPRLVRCRSLTSAVAVRDGVRSYASSACITSSARRGGGGGGGGGADQMGGSDGGRLLAGGLAMAGAALAAGPGEEHTNWGNDKTGGGNTTTTSWGDDRAPGGGRGVGASTVWCDGSASRRLPPSLASFRRRHGKNNLARFAGGGSGSDGSSSSGGESDVDQVDQVGGELRTFDGRLALTAPSARITDVYRFEGNGEPVGRGQRATVSTATHLRTGQTVAVKRLLRAETTRLEVRRGGFSGTTGFVASRGESRLSFLCHSP